MNRPTKKNSAQRQGWIYLGKLVIIAFGILSCLVALKFFTEHRLAPRNSGISGALAQPRLDLLLIGSSHTRKSYDMRLIDKGTGVPASFMITYDGADLVVISQILDYLVTRQDHCPRYLVVEAYSAMLARKHDLQDPRYYFDSPPPLKMTILRSYQSEQGHWATILNDFDLVVNRGNDQIITYPFSAPIVENESYKGGRTDFYFLGLSAREFAALKLDLDSNLPNPAQLAAVHHIIDVARSHHIELIFIDTPMPQPVSSNPDIQKLKKNFREILAARQVPYIDGDQGFPIDDPSLFSDKNHLSSKGREEFTKKIIVVLNSWMASHPVNEK